MSHSEKIYRVYCYDATDKVVTADLVEADNDAEAIEKAKAAGFGSKCEIWEGKRLVAQLDDERRRA